MLARVVVYLAGSPCERTRLAMERIQEDVARRYYRDNELPEMLTSSGGHWGHSLVNQPQSKGFITFVEMRRGVEGSGGCLRRL